ncbi:MAG: pyruvate dehydrogenase complex dihydrolipoamide acetyltransferase [Rhodospirillales bacterium]|nr:pyruvate dehydrogenase complex dihydrolipoamide acetyltransferase [Rhodospirillales bacterium]
MPIEILMPALSPTMTEGNLVKWMKAEGDTVTSGEVLAEIETDKATMEVEAVEEGTLGKIVVAEGTQGVPVNQVIAILLEEGESAADIGDVATAPAAVTTPTPEPVPPVAAAPAPVPAPASPAPVAAQASVGSRVFASPLARRIAANAGVDIASVTGSGPYGRIVKQDVETALVSGSVTAQAAPASGPTSRPSPAVIDETGLAPYQEIPHSSMRKIIAARLTESKQTIPHFYLSVDCELDNLLELRRNLNARSDDYKLSVNDFIIRAVALALRKVPAANAMFTPDALRVFGRVDVAVAVAIPDGLITPVIRDAAGKGLVEISNEMKGLAARARDGKLMPEEYKGGSFTISNLGMFGIKSFSAIINPPQSCILAVGAGEQQAVVKNGALAVATVMSCTLAVDHRVVDGSVGAEFLAAFKPLIEDPISMLL